MIENFLPNLAGDCNGLPQRRRLLQSLLAVTGGGLCSMPILAAALSKGPDIAQDERNAGQHYSLNPSFMEGKRRLVIIRLLGGNDNLNTLVPYTDPLYRSYRPTIGLPTRRVIRLSDELGFNDALKPLAKIYEAGEVAVIQEVGKPGFELSHFVSNDQWSMGRVADETGNTSVARQGWIGSSYLANSSAQDISFDAQGIVLGSDGLSMSGRKINSLQVQSIAGLRSLGAASGKPIHPSVQSAAALHLAEMLNLSVTAAQRVGAKLTGENRFIQYFSNDNYLRDDAQRQAALMLWMIENGVKTPVYQLDIAGFDLHGNLPGTHEERLHTLAQLVEDLRFNLKAIGAWDETLLMVHSEFGRRPIQNASEGTDHGSAGPAFLIGGRVRGGLIGARADLARLDGNGNISYGIDFRRLYATVLASFWELPVNPFAASGHMPIDGVWA